ncbi:DUF4271 domain-containing protein [Lacihabitans lacunae]|uniref:DUF4271 domain-containing protein n=1 Tax=Lacihabitans lacunae TaxID=1028214 RepID=A0ABV7YV07_9BACT
MKYIISILLIFSSLINAFCETVGPKNEYVVLQDYKYLWTTYDSDLKSFTPYIKENSQDTEVYSLEIPISDFHKSYLLIKSDLDNTYLFLDYKLSEKLKKDTWKILPIESLLKTYKKPKVILSVFGHQNPERIQVYMAYPKNETSIAAATAKKNPFNFLPRNITPYFSSLVLIFIITTTMMTFLSNNYTKAFRRFYSFKDLTSFMIKETSFLVNKPLDRPNMMFVIFLSMIIGFITMMSSNKGLDIFSSGFIFQSGDTFGVYITNFFKVCILIFTLFVLKYFFIKIIGKLFNIEKVVDIHFFKLIQTSVFFFSGLLIVFLFAQNIFIPLKENFLTIATAVISIFYLLRVLVIYFTINRTSNIKTLYLISYLCIVELLPTLIGLRYITTSLNIVNT